MITVVMQQHRIMTLGASVGLSPSPLFGSCLVPHTTHTDAEHDTRHEERALNPGAKTLVFTIDRWSDLKTLGLSQNSFISAKTTK